MEVFCMPAGTPQLIGLAVTLRALCTSCNAADFSEVGTARGISSCGKICSSGLLALLLECGI